MTTCLEPSAAGYGLLARREALNWHVAISWLGRQPLAGSHKWQLQLRFGPLVSATPNPYPEACGLQPGLSTA